ncbi:MAG: helical backbone metal receptor [Planctomycetota bacterium]
MPRRIVSLAPSITETLFALGVGDRVAGVTRFCLYPEAARAKPKVGGFYDPNYEAIVGLEADLVILFPEHEKPRARLEALGIRTLAVDHRTIADILDSIRAIGGVCGEKERAEEMVRSIEARLRAVAEKTRGLPKPRVMISIGRSFGSGTLQEVYIAGSRTLYSEILVLAGGENVRPSVEIPFPIVSAEGILRMDPDAIVDLVPGLRESGFAPEALRREWEALPGLRAAREGRVYLFEEDFVVIPGPRFACLVENLARALHPEAAWDKPVQAPTGGGEGASPRPSFSEGTGESSTSGR